MSRPCTKPHRFVGLRVREDAKSPDNPMGLELRCPDCAADGHVAAWWPLVPEFWHTKAFTRCRACHATRDRRLHRDRYRADPAYRARVQARVAKFRQAHPTYGAQNRSDWRRLKAPAA